MIDTHTHLYLSDNFPDSQADEAVERALEAGVNKMIMPNIDVSTVTPLVEMSMRYPAKVFIAMGLHPTEVRENWQSDLDKIFPSLSFPSVKGVGEIGLDFYWDKTFALQQTEAFEAQLKWALEYKLPVIIHQRDALDQTLASIFNIYSTSFVPLVFHCFTGSSEDVRRIRSVVPDAYFGIGGVVTYKSASNLRQALSEIGIGHILLETDSPYLAPVPKRGRRNESSYLRYIAECIAAELNMDFAEVDAITSKNAERIFKL